jgi:protein Xni
MHLLIIDAMNLIRRVYAAVEGNELAAEATMTRSLAIIHGAASRSEATHWVMVFEDHHPTWRHDLWSEYKAGRSPMPEALEHILGDIRKYLEMNGVHTFNLSGWEADDIAATLAVKAGAAGLAVTLLSTDKGFCQLVNSSTRVLNHFDRLWWDEEQVRERWGFEPARLPDFWALTGDQTNHLPGVAGIGAKGAGQVLDSCQTLDRALAWPDLAPERYRKALKEGWQSALITRELARLRTDVPLGISLSALRASR